MRNLGKCSFGVVLGTLMISTVVCLGQSSRPSDVQKDSPGAVIHYIPFNFWPISPWTISEIEHMSKARYKLSRHEAIDLYSIVKRHGRRAKYKEQFTRLIIEANRWGPRTLVANDSHVKIGKDEFHLGRSN